MLLYSLEAPHQGASNEYNNICFYGELEKIIPELSSNKLPYQVPCYLSAALKLCDV